MPAPPSDLFALDDSESFDRPSERTEQAPSFVERGRDAALTPTSGGPLPDFVLVREIGKGGLARVYLAHQLSLDRKVALKLSAIPSQGEGKILAGLEHDHIVKVYTEFHDPVGDRHGLVLQYIAGTHLGRVLEDLFRDGAAPTAGKDILEVIDAHAPDEVDFNPAALRDREMYEQGDYVATMCRLTACLAEALAYAHSRGILHCDVKPANILLNAYGRPLLVDFNVAVPTKKDDDAAPALGGTVFYMAPEQLAQFLDTDAPPGNVVDHRADLYSLGLVLTEALLGRLPSHPLTPDRQPDRAALLERKSQSPERWLADGPTQAPAVVWRVLARCLAPDPEQRYPSGMDLASGLRRAADLHAANADLPPEGWLSRAARVWPVATLLTLTLVPHFIGSVINIAYNSVQIPLDAPQRALFGGLILVYNVIAYPVCLTLGILVLRPLMKATREIQRWPFWPTSELDRLRRRTLVLGPWIVLLALLGWLPGGLFFPLALHLLAGPVGFDVFGHFLLSFTLSGLIAIIYSYLGVQFVVLRGLYPRLMHAEQTAGDMEDELRRIVGPMGLFQILAALVPLVGAVLLLTLAPTDLTLGFRFLVVALIGAGLLGLGVAVSVTGHLRQLAQHLSGADRSDR